MNFGRYLLWLTLAKISIFALEMVYFVSLLSKKLHFPSKFSKCLIYHKQFQFTRPPSARFLPLIHAAYLHIEFQSLALSDVRCDVVVMLYIYGGNRGSGKVGERGVEAQRELNLCRSCST